MFSKEVYGLTKSLPRLFLYLFLGAEKIPLLSFLMMAALEEVGNSLYSQHQKVFPRISGSLKNKTNKKFPHIKSHLLRYYSPLKTSLTSVSWHSPMVTPIYSVFRVMRAGTARVSGPITSSHTSLHGANTNTTII